MRRPWLADRVFAGVAILLVCGYGYFAFFAISAPIQYDPLGPERRPWGTTAGHRNPGAVPGYFSASAGAQSRHGARVCPPRRDGGAVAGWLCHGVPGARVNGAYVESKGKHYSLDWTWILD